MSRQEFKRSAALAGVICLLLLIVNASLHSRPAEAAGVIYVDAAATGANNGTSWADAYAKLQDALAPATSGDQIWVAAGVYYPDEGGGMTDDDRTMTFTLVEGVEIYGGFEGTETSLSQRNWNTNTTMLSGDITQGGLITTRAFHVLTGGGAGGSAVLDGFTITAGYAYGALSSQQEGAGMVNYGSSPTLSNLIFTLNQANGHGGGIYNNNSSPTLSNILLTGNSSGSSGGGLRNDNSNPVMTNVVFAGNKSQFGGGLYNANGIPVLINVTFSGNLAQFGSGGGMYNASSDPTLVNAIFWENLAGSSGNQIYNSTSTPGISYSDIQGSGGSGAGWDSGLGTDGGGNLDADPLFVTPVDPLTAPTTAGDLHLQAGSPAIDAGDNGACPSIDLNGVPRPQGAACDMGAYERAALYLPLIMR